MTKNFIVFIHATEKLRNGMASAKKSRKPYILGSLKLECLCTKAQFHRTFGHNFHSSILRVINEVPVYLVDVINIDLRVNDAYI
jgi:hypothetical protein